MQTCNICCESSYKIITCPCGFEACNKCCETYILNGTIAASCMDCKRFWQREFIVPNFSQSFVRKYTVFRKAALLELERSKIPQTMPIVSAVNELDDTRKMLKEKRQLYKKLAEEIDELQHQEKVLKNVIVDIDSASHNKAINYTIKCSSAECKGFLDNDYNCAICKKSYCDKCREPTSQDHICDSNILASVKILKSETKPCPKCNAPCFKVDGCDQVFAICCAVAFSWRTGKIETGYIHAPDYYQWLRDNDVEVPRAPGDNPCGVVNPRTLDSQLRKWLSKTNKMLENYNIWQCLQTARHLQANPGRIKLDNLDIRLNYIRNIISESRFTTILHAREKANFKTQEINNLNNTLFDVINTITLNMIQEQLGKNVDENRVVIDNYIKQFTAARAYYNHQMKIIAKNYDCIHLPRYIEQDWKLKIWKETDN